MALSDFITSPITHQLLGRLDYTKGC